MQQVFCDAASLPLAARKSRGKVIATFEGRSYAAQNVVYSDEIGDFGFIRITEGSNMRMPLRQLESVLTTLLRALAVTISQVLTRDPRISGDSRDRAARLFQLAQILEDFVDLLAHVHLMRTFDYAVKRGNHAESRLNLQK
jgi:hypothetical protein